MDSLQLIDAFTEFKQSKNIDREAMMRIIEDSFRQILIKKYGSDENFDVITNTEQGDLEIVLRRTIVSDDDYDDDYREISLSDAQNIDKELEIGDEYYEDMKINDIFGRREILVLEQLIKGRVMEIQKDSIYQKYKHKIGEVIRGEVTYSNRMQAIVVDEDRNEMILSRSEQLPSDFYKKGDIVKAIILKVEVKNTNPVIILSRTDNSFLEKLIESEVPEIADGLITIKAIARTPGEKAKVAVETYDERIDPVGACVGVKGTRVVGITKELKGEIIDVINYTSNLPLYISRALSPAKVIQVDVNPDTQRADVILPADQVSLAIGKKGININLAAQITGYQIDVYREDHEFIDDVAIEEFKDEIEPWILEELKKIGCDTARSVLNLSADELLRRTDLEESTIEDVLQIFRNEFE